MSRGSLSHFPTYVIISALAYHIEGSVLGIEQYHKSEELVGDNDGEHLVACHAILPKQA